MPRYLGSLISVMILSLSIKCLICIHAPLPAILWIMSQVFLMDVLELIFQT